MSSNNPKKNIIRISMRFKDINMWNYNDGVYSIKIIRTFNNKYFKTHIEICSRLPQSPDPPPKQLLNAETNP